MMMQKDKSRDNDGPPPDIFNSNTLSAPLASTDTSQQREEEISRRIETLRLQTNAIDTSVPPPIPLATVSSFTAPPPTAPVQSPTKESLYSAGIEMNDMNFSNLYPTLEKPAVSLPPPSFEETVRRNPAPAPTQARQLSPHTADANTLIGNSDILRQQQEIMERIQRSKTKTTTATVTQPRSLQGQTVHGQTVTASASQGEVHLVQCTGCSGWMQVVMTATLVFCPTCQVVSKVAEANTRSNTASAVRSERGKR